VRKVNPKAFIKRCECTDPGCPVHKGADLCLNHVAFSLRRIDITGKAQVRFCQACALDAFASGVFA